MSAQLVIDYSKIVYAAYFHRNQTSTLTRRVKPRKPTINGVALNMLATARPYFHDYPHETVLERARRLDAVDTWIPVCVLGTVRQKFRFEGEEAIKQWKAYKSFKFGKRK